MDRGLLIAHKETWDQFIRQREGNPHRMMFNETDDVLVVFEGIYDPPSHECPSPYSLTDTILLMLSNTLFLNLFFISCVALISLLMTLLLSLLLVVTLFADDVYETVPNIKQAMISEVENMNTDIKVSACNLTVDPDYNLSTIFINPPQSLLQFILILTISLSPVSWLVYVE